MIRSASRRLAHGDHPGQPGQPGRGGQLGCFGRAGPPKFVGEVFQNFVVEFDNDFQHGQLTMFTGKMGDELLRVEGSHGFRSKFGRPRLRCQHGRLRKV